MAEHPYFDVDVVTPESVVWSGTADFVLARTTEGEMGVLWDHEPTMAALSTGAVEIQSRDGARVTVGIHGGFLQVFRNQVTLLTDRAEISESREEALRVAAELEAVEAAENGDAA